MANTNNQSNKSASYEAYIARVANEKIPCYEPSLGDEEIALLTEVIQRNWLSENKYTREFEMKLAKICDRKYALALSNATAALITGMKCLGIGPGDEVIVPSFSHPADPNSISQTGATPVFADVDEETLCLSVKTIDAVKTDKTKGILLVDLYGNAPELDEIEKYARQYKLYLINDCAAALGSIYRNRSIGAYGDFSVLSFFADKTITTGEGGMLLTDNIDLINEANIYKHDGRKERGVDLIEKKGYNFRITELQTAVGVAQLNKLDFFIRRKKAILHTYEKLLSGIPGVSVFEFNKKGDIVPHRVLLFVAEALPLIDHLTGLGIGVRTTFMPMHSQPTYDVKKEFPITEKLHATGVCLPSAPTLSNQQISFVCESIRNFFSKVGK